MSNDVVSLVATILHFGIHWYCSAVATIFLRIRSTVNLHQPTNNGAAPMLASLLMSARGATTLEHSGLRQLETYGNDDTILFDM